MCTREQLNDALDEISRLQVQAAAARMVNTHTPQVPFTPLKTPVTRFKEHLEPSTVYKTPYLTPVKQAKQDDTTTTPPLRAVITPTSRALTPKNASVSARKIRTPVSSANSKSQKHGLRFWKRMAKRRMFA